MKILVLENEFWDSKSIAGGYLKGFKRIYNISDEDVTIIDFAHERKDEVAPAIMSHDILLFQTTWIRHQQLYPLGLVLTQRKEPMKIYTCGSIDRVEREIEEIWKVEQLAAMSHHKLYKLGYFTELEDEFPIGDDEFEKKYKNQIQEVRLQPYQDEMDRRKREEKKIKSTARVTGFRVRIGKVVGNSKEFSELKEGMVVDELSFPEGDPNPDRGIWVRGITEPVKLLNEGSYREWSYADLDPLTIAVEIFAAAGKKLSEKEFMILFAIWINNASVSDEKETPGEIHSRLTDLLDLLGLPRRYFRDFFERKITEYNKEHQYFSRYNKMDVRRIFELKLDYIMEAKEKEEK